MAKLSTRKAIEHILACHGVRNSLTAARAAEFGLAYPLRKGWKRDLAIKLDAKRVAANPDAQPTVTKRKAKLIYLAKKADRKQAPKVPAGTSFYASWEWKQARFEALKRHGRRCMCCGWSPEEGRAGHLVVDHIKPRSKFPHLALDPDNLQILCNDCNMGKSNRHYDDFRQPVEEQEEVDLSYDEEAAAFRDMLH